MTKFLFYTCRHGDYEVLTPHTKEAWDFLISEMEQCNGASAEEICQYHDDSDYNPDYDGSWEQGFFYIDDGGDIKTIELTENFT